MWRPEDPYHRGIPPSIHHVAPLRSGGVPGTLQVPVTHRDGILYCQHSAVPEPLKPASLQPPDGVRAGGYPPALPPTPVIPPPEDLVPGPARHIVACMLQLHPGFRLLDIQDSGDPLSAELFSDHFVMQAHLIQVPTRCNWSYLWGC